MSDERPKDLTVALRQMAQACHTSYYPKWFMAEALKDASCKPWGDLLNQAADELEAMQMLNGRLLRRLAGD